MTFDSGTAGKGKHGGKQGRDLTIYYSTTNPKPEASTCEGMVENTGCLSIDANQERYFTRDYVFLKMETIGGCKANLKLVFPKQDLFDAKSRKGEQQKGASLVKNKNRLQKEIEF